MSEEEIDNSLKISYGRVAKLPALVRAFCFSHEGWIVGSGAKFLLNLMDTSPRDWDILIPFFQWGHACKIIPVGSPTNSQGGIKIHIENDVVDVWAGDIGWFLAQTPNFPSYAVQPKTMTFLISNRQVLRDR